MFRVQADGPIHSLIFASDGRLIVDQETVIGPPDTHGHHPVRRELVWREPLEDVVVRRFRLIDTIDGPRGGLARVRHPARGYPEGEHPIGVAYCPLVERVVVAWPWHSVEDPVAVYDLTADAVECFRFWGRVQQRAVAFAPDGRSILQGVQYQRIDEWALRLWPAEADGRFSQDWDGGGPVIQVPGDPTAVAFDGRRAAVKVEDWVGGRQVEDGAYVWDTGMSRLRHLAPGFLPRLFAFAAGSPLLAVGGMGWAVWHCDKEQWVQSGGTPAEVRSLAFDPAGRRLAAGLADGTLLLRDLSGGGDVRLQTAAAAVSAVAFAPDGLTCAAGSSDGQLVVWDVE